MQSLGSGAAHARHTDILTAFARNVPLPQIIAAFNLSPEDLHTFLTTPGIPDRLQALRALARFDQDLRTIQAQNEATDFLRGFLKDDSHKPEERRRAATALLRGPGPARTASTKDHDRQGGASPPAKPDIVDWSASDSALDAEDDATLDEDTEDAEAAEDSESAHAHPRPVSTGRGGRGSARPERGVPVSEPAPERKEPPRLPLTATPDEIVANQLACIQAIDKPALTPSDIYGALDYHHLSFYNRYYAANAIAFEQALINSPLLDIAGAELTADPAILHDTTPPTATVRVTIKRPAPSIQNPQSKIQNLSVLFHLAHEPTHFRNEGAPSAWHTKSITRDDSG